MTFSFSISVVSEDLRPVITNNNITIADIRRTDNRVLYTYTLVAENGTVEIIWRYSSVDIEIKNLFSNHNISW